MADRVRLHTFAIPIGVLLLRNGVPLYQSIRASYNAQKPSIREPPPEAARALNILFLFALTVLLYTLPYFSPENIFQVTHGRLQTSNEVLFTRLAAKLPLTQFDQDLKSKLTSQAGRLVYLAYGPEAIAHCNFCSPNDPRSYFYYSLPMLAIPHLLHLLILGLVTSPLVAGSEGARWRTQATLAGLALGAADLYLHMTYDFLANSASTHGLNDLDFFYWRMRLIRGIGAATIDGLLGFIMYLSSTNRFFLAPLSPAGRLESATSALEASNFRLWATGNVRNAAIRDRELRESMLQYWQDETQIFEEVNVVKTIRATLERTDMRALSNAADQRSTDILNTLS